MNLDEKQFLFLARSLTLCDLEKVIPHVWGLDRMFKGLYDSVCLSFQTCNLPLISFLAGSESRQLAHVGGTQTWNQKSCVVPALSPTSWVASQSLHSSGSGRQLPSLQGRWQYTTRELLGFCMQSGAHVGQRGDH